MKDKWIPIDRKPPPNFQRVIIFYESAQGDAISIASIDNRGLWSTRPNHYLSRTEDIVTHWMPLPEPPKK